MNRQGYELCEVFMSKLVLRYQLVIILLFCSSVSALTPTTYSKNCFVITKTIYKNGEISSKTSSFNFNTEAECQKMRKLLSDNFDPQKINKVSAKYEWRMK